MPVIFATQSAYLLRIILLSFFVLILAQLVSGQAAADSIVAPVADSLPVPDTPAIVTDSLPIMQSVDSVSRIPWLYANWELDPGKPLLVQVLQRHPYFAFGSQPVVLHTGLRQFQGKEILFYGLIGLLMAFAFLRQAFPKYFNDLFRLFFRTTLKQKQVREQLMQTPVPSLLLNVFFVVSGGLYIDILLQHFDSAPIDNFWLLFLYCALGLSIIYTIKFLGLKISGWLFNMKEGGDTYIFVVFIINKVIGIFLLPFLVLLSFMEGNVYTVAMVLSWCGIGVLLIYRFLLTYTSVRNQVRFNPFHFFLYLCAFEIAPLLLIYKALLFFFR
jgi:hypothetical protein